MDFSTTHLGVSLIAVLASKQHNTGIFLIALPLALSAFTHLWNPTGFPTFFIDESGYYLPRAMHFLETGNPKDDFPRYDHPYFGWIFLAGALLIFGYSDSLSSSSDIHSIQTLYFYPRVLMGILAVLDTFLIYKISKARYNTSVALIASILFAVMPLTWINRRILLESIQLPFLLSSILFAVYTKNGLRYVATHNAFKSTIVFPLLSGAFLGIAIFTKIPAIVMILLVGYIIYSNTRKNVWVQNKAMMLWLIPIIFISLLWPAHAFSIGQFDEWKDDLLYHIEREDQPLALSLQTIFNIDPVLTTLGFAGLAFAAVRKDFVLLLWAVPFLIFLQMIGFVSFFHLIPLIPLFCISGAVLIVNLLSKVRWHDVGRILPFITVFGIGIFGLICTTMLVTQNLTSSYFELSSFIAEAIPEDNNGARMTIIGSIHYFWIPQYVLNKDDHIYQSYYSSEPVETKDVLLIKDRQFNRLLNDNNTDWRKERLTTLQENTYQIAMFKEETKFNYAGYPYSGQAQVSGIGKVELRTNSSDTPIMLDNDADFMLEPIFNGIKFPTSMAFLGPNDILILEKNEGTVKRIVNGTMLPEPVLDVNVANANERGMLGIAVAKRDNNGTGTTTNNSTTPYVFLYYTEARAADGEDVAGGSSINNTNNNGTTTTTTREPLGNRLYRYEFLNGKLTNPKLLLDLPASPGPSHNGGTIEIGPDGNVYLTIGDLRARSGRESTAAANIDDSIEPDGRGGILRVTQDGETVGTGILGDTHPLNKYYAYGIRNSFGIDFDPVTGKLWDTEDGPNYGDEINLVEQGFNSGWKKVQGIWIPGENGNPKEDDGVFASPDDLIDFNGNGTYSSPEFVWEFRIAPTAVKFLHSEKYGESFTNDLLVADFNQGNIYHFDLIQNRTGLILGGSLSDKIGENREDLDETIFTKAPGGITDMEIGPDGYLYILTVGGTGGDCTPQREKCVDYDGPIAGRIFKVIPRN